MKELGEYIFIDCHNKNLVNLDNLPSGELWKIVFVDVGKKPEDKRCIFVQLVNDRNRGVKASKAGGYQITKSQLPIIKEIIKGSSTDQLICKIYNS